MIRSALAAYADTTARTFEAREQTVGASDVGRCARAVYFEKNEYDPAFGAPRNPDAVSGWGSAGEEICIASYILYPGAPADAAAALATGSAALLELVLLALPQPLATRTEPAHTSAAVSPRMLREGPFPSDR